jgi:hypothetical protein
LFDEPVVLYRRLQLCGEIGQLNVQPARHLGRGNPFAARRHRRNGPKQILRGNG